MNITTTVSLRNINKKEPNDNQNAIQSTVVQRRRSTVALNHGADVYDTTRYVGAPPLPPLPNCAAPDEHSDVGTSTDDEL